MQANEATTIHPILAGISIMGSGRVGPTAAALIGLVGTVIGGLALARANRRTSSGTDVGATSTRSRATAAAVLGAISLVLGGLFLAAADGGPGTGNGVVGSTVAIVVGPIAVVLGGLARSRRRQDRSLSHVQLESSASGVPRAEGPKTS
jgi:hypothetical protein